MRTKWHNLKILFWFITFLSISCSSNNDNQNDSLNNLDGYAPNSLEGHNLAFYRSDNSLQLKLSVKNNTPTYYSPEMTKQIYKSEYEYEKTGSNTADLHIYVSFKSTSNKEGVYHYQMELTFTSPTKGTCIGIDNGFGSIPFKKSNFTMDIKSPSDEHDEEISITISECTINSIKSSSVLISGRINIEGNATLTECGLCLNTKPNPTIDSYTHKQKLDNTEGEKKVLIQGLKDNQKYYVRIYAVCNKKTYYGKETEFTTSQTANEEPDHSTIPIDFFKVELQTVSPECIKVAYSYDENKIKDYGITQTGICWGNHAKPTIDDILGTPEAYYGYMPKKVVCQGGSPGTDYYVRLYALVNNEFKYFNEFKVQTVGKDIKLAVNTQYRNFIYVGTIEYEITKKGTFELNKFCTFSYSFPYDYMAGYESLGYVENKGNKSFQYKGTDGNHCGAFIKEISTGIEYYDK